MLPEAEVVLLFEELEYEPFSEAGAVVPVVVVLLYAPVLVEAGVVVISVLDRVE